MKNTHLLKTTILLLFVLALAACSGSSATAGDTATTVQTEAQTAADSITVANQTQMQTDLLADVDTDDIDDEDLEVVDASAADTRIELLGSQITFEGSGVTVAGTSATITAAGTYTISGTLNDGQIIVDTQDEGPVVLVLNGIDITSLTSAPIYVRSADKVVLTLGGGTQNHVADSTSYTFDEGDEPNAAIFSKADLTINGAGELTVNASFNNGIASKDDLKIISGMITVTSANDGLKGRDSVSVLDGTIVINAGGDGIQSNNDVDAGEGNIFIDGGTFQITTELDGIQAENTLVVTGGNIAIVTAGGSANGTHVSRQFGDWDQQAQDTGSDISAKGLKAGVTLLITGGAFEIDSADDALHANGAIQINAGEFNLASGDDGAHADTSLVISGGTLTITKSYEGIESANIQINNGTISLTSSDDGINGGTSQDGGPGFGGGQQPGAQVTTTTASALQINGGYVYVNAGGDGIDINDPVEMNGGVVIVNGPTENMNGALDYTGYFNITGGFLVAVGSAGMAEAPSQSSTQYSVLYAFANVQPAGTTVHIESQSGENILTFTPAKDFQTVVISSDQLINGDTYSVYTGGEVSGTQVNGLLSDGSYAGGSLADSFTITGLVTTAGSFSGGFMGNPGGGPGGGPGGKP